METEKPAESMSRWEVINALRIYAHPTWYHSLLSWSTPRLKALLVFYREDAKEGNRELEPRPIRGIAIAAIELKEITPKVGLEIRKH